MLLVCLHKQIDPFLRLQSIKILKACPWVRVLGQGYKNEYTQEREKCMTDFEKFLNRSWKGFMFKYALSCEKAVRYTLQKIVSFQ